MAPSPKGLHKKRLTAPRRAAAVKAALSAAPLVPLEKAQQAASKLRPAHPTLDDDTAALCVLHLSTQLSIREIAKQLGAAHSWCYARITRPDVQAFLQQLSQTLLGVAAARSIATLKHLSESSKDEAMRYRASTELLDRAGMGNTTQMRQAGVSQPYAFSFAPAPPPKET